MPKQDPSLVRYARRIERRWSDLVDRPVILSRHDWSRISRWYSWGVPLDLIDETLRSATGPEGGRGVRGLAQLGPAIEESWAVIVQGRIVQHPFELGSNPEDPRAAWSRCILEQPPDSPLARTLAKLLARLDRGDDPDVLDQELDHQLTEIVPAERVQLVLAELERELSEYRSRMSTDRLQATRTRACQKRLRHALNLPRLARDRSTE
jgi:hypothetical protein